MSIRLIIFGLFILPLVYLLFSWSEIIDILLFLFFCWLLSFVLFYFRAKLSLGKFLTQEKLTSRSNDISIPCGWDGTGKFLQIFGIPIEYIGIILGILISPFLGKSFAFRVFFPYLIFFTSGSVIAIGIYYLILELRYNVKIEVYNYGRKQKT